MVDAAMNGDSMFFTGNAGTGKTTTLKAVIKALKRKHGRELGRKHGVFVTASTGAAAVHCGGMTLHSFAGVGLAKEEAYILGAK